MNTHSWYLAFDLWTSNTLGYRNSDTQIKLTQIFHRISEFQQRTLLPYMTTEFDTPRMRTSNRKRKIRRVLSWVKAKLCLTLILLTWTIWRAPTNASKWRMGFNSAFKGLNQHQAMRTHDVQAGLQLSALCTSAPNPGLWAPGHQLGPHKKNWKLWHKLLPFPGFGHTHTHS
jgi:hypothetical protein